MKELKNFNRKALSPTEERVKQVRKPKELTCRERLNHQILCFDHSKLRRVTIKEKKLPNVVLHGMKKSQPNEEFELRFAPPKKDQISQTERYIDELKAFLANKKKLKLSISTSPTEASSKNDSGFVSPASTVKSPEYLDKSKWRLVEENVCRVRVTETEYF